MAIPPIIPPPKSKPPPAAQGGTGGPPILIPHSPSTTYHPGAIQSHFAPQQAPSSGHYSSAGVSPGAPAPLSATAPGHLTTPQQVAAQHAAAAVRRVNAVTQFTNFLAHVKHTFTGGSMSSATDINPLAKGWYNLSVDMGVDANAPVGAPILAPNDSVVTNIQSNWYGSQPLLAMQIVKGPNKGKYWYVAERIAGPHSTSLANGDGLPQKGTLIKQGQPVARYATSGTGIEIGWAADAAGTTLSAAHGTVHTAAGNEHRPGGTPEGQDFLHNAILGGAKPGKVNTGALKAQQASAKFTAAIMGGKPVKGQGITLPQTAGKPSGPPIPQKVTPTVFAVATLKSLGIKPTTANVQALTAWEQAEGGHWNNQAQYNPLNTKMPESGSTTPAGFVSAGIRAYPSWATGLKGTVDTLKNGDYGGILDALRRGASVSSFSAAVSGSPWGTGPVGVSGTTVPQSQIDQLAKRINGLPSTPSGSSSSSGSASYSGGGSTTGGGSSSGGAAPSSYSGSSGSSSGSSGGVTPAETAALNSLTGSGSLPKIDFSSALVDALLAERPINVSGTFHESSLLSRAISNALAGYTR